MQRTQELRYFQRSMEFQISEEIWGKIERRISCRWVQMGLHRLRFFLESSGQLEVQIEMEGLYEKGEVAEIDNAKVKGLDCMIPPPLLANFDYRMGRSRPLLLLLFLLFSSFISY